MKIKKSVIIFLFIILLIIIISTGALTIRNLTYDNNDYEGELAESKQQQNLSIFVLPTIPIISITSPENKTYSTNMILLNYSIANKADFIWYNLDNEINITIDSPLQFTATQESHTLYLYANNSEGTSVKSITFSIKIETIQQPSGEGGGGGSKGGGTGNKTGQQEENITTSKEPSPNFTKQETPKNMTENQEETPRTTKQITINFLISWFFLILLITLVIILITIIKRKRDRKKRKAK